jgi:hypothetical protein
MSATLPTPQGGWPHHRAPPQKPVPHFSPIPCAPANLPPSPSRSEIMTSGWGGGVGREGVDPPHTDRIIVTSSHGDAGHERVLHTRQRAECGRQRRFRLGRRGEAASPRGSVGSGVPPIVPARPNLAQNCGLPAIEAKPRRDRFTSSNRRVLTRPASRPVRLPERVPRASLPRPSAFSCATQGVPP